MPKFLHSVERIEVGASSPLRTQVVLRILGKFLKRVQKSSSAANLADEFIVQKKGFLVVKDNDVRNTCRKKGR